MMGNESTAEKTTTVLTSCLNDAEQIQENQRDAWDDMSDAISGLNCLHHLIGITEDLHTVSGAELDCLLSMVHDRIQQLHLQLNPYQ